MDKNQSDLVESYKLETKFLQHHVRHTRYVKKAKTRNRKVEEDWRNCGELGKGGFGVVHKQIQDTTGQYRAVKTINKEELPSSIDPSRELLVMGILAKNPPLFVEFLGWFEDPETLYIAMEYLEEGDLTKHISSPLPQNTVQNISKQILEGLKVMHEQGIAHRDLKPANIFVVSMSPVWVKLGDFGISKRVHAQATTSFMTQVATQIYGAPEVLGLDTYSETSVYTNSVDIWSLGCVIYELLAGTRLFGSWPQVSSYYHGKMPFPEDKLKALSPPTDDVGISLIRSMLTIKPEDRPTAADALGNEWLAGLEGDDKRCGDDQDKMAQYRELSTGNVALGGDPESRWDSDPTAPKPEIDPVTTTPLGVASVESSLIQKGSGENRDRQYSTEGSPRPPARYPPMPDPRGENSQRAPRTNEPVGYMPGREAPASTLYLPTTRNSDWQIHPAEQTCLMSDDSATSEDGISQNPAPNARGGGGGPTNDLMRNPNTRRNPNGGQNPNVGRVSNQNPNVNSNPNQNPNATPNPNWNPNVNSNPNRNPNTGSNPNQNPNVRWNPISGGNPNMRWNPNAGGNSDIGWGSNARGNRDQAGIQTY